MLQYIDIYTFVLAVITIFLKYIATCLNYCAKLEYLISCSHVSHASTVMAIQYIDVMHLKQACHVNVFLVVQILTYV